MPFFRKNRKWNEGFTLVELLVVIAIIAILATILLLNLGSARAKSRDVKRVADINQIRSAFELFFDDQNPGHYPSSNTVANLTSDLVTGTVKYLNKLPMDPGSNGSTCTAYSGWTTAASCYGYAFSPTIPTKYHLWAELEQRSAALNTDADFNSTGWTGAPVDASNSSTSEKCSDSTTRDCVFDLAQQ